MSLFRSSPTSLDLNGATLYFSTQPVGVATSTSSSASLTGIATVSFMTVGDVANPATGTGTIDINGIKLELVLLLMEIMLLVLLLQL